MSFNAGGLRYAASSARRASSRLSAAQRCRNRRPDSADQKRSEAYATNLLFMGWAKRWPITPKSCRPSDGFRLRKHRMSLAHYALDLGLIRNYARFGQASYGLRHPGKARGFEPSSPSLEAQVANLADESRITARSR